MPKGIRGGGYPETKQRVHLLVTDDEMKILREIGTREKLPTPQLILKWVRERLSNGASK